MAVEIVETASRCEQAINDFVRHYEAYPVLGFDCEWVTSAGHRNKVAMLQLAAIDGECLLIRLFKLAHIPENLKRLLGNGNILKVGVEPDDDAQKLLEDFGIKVRGTIDLRFLARRDAPNPGSLEVLAKKYLDVTLDKDWRVRAFNWETPSLPTNQAEYAARDAQVAASIFKKLASLLWPNANWARIFGNCADFVDRRYS